MNTWTLLHELEKMHNALEEANKHTKVPMLASFARSLDYLIELAKRDLEAGIKKDSFEKELTALLNRHSKENGSNTPDFILSDYLQHCLDNFNSSVTARNDWYRIKDEPIIHNNFDIDQK